MQKNSKSVQGKLYEAAANVFKGERIEIYGSGRTDAGVHALRQVAHLDVKTMLAPEIIRIKINDDLPADINLLEVEKTDPKFHARYDAKSRIYLYQVARRRTSFGKNFVWWIKDQLNFEKMNNASKLFVGMHDFVSFADKDDDEKSTKVLIENVQLKEEGDLILIRITGSHFLWKQVRRMVGTLVEVGRGNLTQNDIKYYLEHKSPAPAQYTAPPSGLFLERIIYAGDSYPADLIPTINISSEKKVVLRKNDKGNRR